MPGTAYEMFDSRVLEEGVGATFRYVVVGTSDELEALALARAASPASYEGILRGQIRQQPLGGGVYHVDVPYTITQRPDADAFAGSPPAGAGGAGGAGGADPNAPLGEEYSFSSGGGTVRRLRGISQATAGHPRHTVDEFGIDGENPPDFRGFINVTPDGIEGVEVEAPQSSFTIAKTFRLLTHGWFVAMQNVVGKINKLPWRGFQSCEVLFCGCDGGYRGDGWPLTFKFKFSPSAGTLATLDSLKIPIPIVTGENPGDPNRLEVTEKRGHDYLWVARRSKVDTIGDTKTVIEEAYAAYVERVYDTQDFGILGLDD